MINREMRRNLNHVVMKNGIFVSFPLSMFITVDTDVFIGIEGRVLSYIRNLVVPESDRKANLQRQGVVRNPCDSNALKLLSTLTINRFRETFQVFSRTLIYSKKLMRIFNCVQQVWPPEAFYHLILQLLAKFDSRAKSKYAYAIENCHNKNQCKLPFSLRAKKRRWIKGEIFCSLHVT